jgi:hypothetical protein
MITVEVLISLLILFLVIATSSVMVKHLFSVQLQQKHIEDLYTEVLSIRDRIDDILCREGTMQLEGVQDGFSYRGQCTPLQQVRSFHWDTETLQGGNTGPLLLRIYQVDLNVSRGRFEHGYRFLKTRVSRTGS